MQIGLDVVTSANCKSRLQFYLLNLTSTDFFHLDLSIMASLTDRKPSMTWTKLLFSSLAITAIVIAIWILGPMLSRYLDKKDRIKTGLHGIRVRGIVTGKGQWKGRQIYFVYNYQGKYYDGQMDYGNYKRDDYNYYNSFKKGDSIEVLLDSLSPENSVLIR
jgi:hypothetical protein